MCIPSLLQGIWPYVWVIAPLDMAKLLIMSWTHAFQVIRILALITWRIREIRGRSYSQVKTQNTIPYGFAFFLIIYLNLKFSPTPVQRHLQILGISSERNLHLHLQMQLLQAWGRPRYFLVTELLKMKNLSGGERER